MPSSIRSSLPLDVIHTVATLTERADLPSLLLTNRQLNQLLTPILYFTVNLNAWDNIAKCIRTLKAPPSRCMLGRDLAGLVRTFELRRPLTRLPFYVSKTSLDEDILHFLPRMSNLRSFSSEIILPFHSWEILRTLVSGTSRFLESVQMELCEELVWKPDGLSEDNTEELAVRVPSSLHTLKLKLPESLTPRQARFLKASLGACSATLRSLSLVAEGHAASEQFWVSVLPRHEVYDALQALEIDCNGLAHPSLAQATQVKSLKIAHPWDASRTPPCDLFPSLRELLCARELLPKFLPQRIELRRPIEALHINNVLENSNDYYPGLWSEPPTWSELLSSIEHLQYSTTAVRSLSFDVYWLTNAGLESIRAHFQGLEHMAIRIVYRNSKQTCLLCQLVTDLVAYMPRLHTLLVAGFSIVPPNFARISRVYDLMKFSRAVLVPTIEESAPWLRRMVLLEAQSLELVKKEDGWHWMLEHFGPNARGHLYNDKGWWEEEEVTEVQQPISCNDALNSVSEEEDDSDLEDTRFLPFDGEQ